MNISRILDRIKGSFGVHPSQITPYRQIETIIDIKPITYNRGRKVDDNR
jgi:hypothetical protein